MAQKEVAFANFIKVLIIWFSRSFSLLTKMLLSFSFQAPTPPKTRSGKPCEIEKNKQKEEINFIFS